MKGLLVKDYRFLLGQKSSFLIFIGLGLFFLLTGEDVNFGVSYAMIFAAIFAAGSITYDSHENGMAYLLTLPIQKKGYVAEKYLFSLAVIVLMGAVMGAMVLGCGMFGGTVYETEVVIDAFVMAFTMAVTMIAIMIPIYVIFGAEKARIAIMVIAGVIAVLVFVVSEFAEDAMVKVTEFLTKLDGLSELQSALLLAGVFAVILGISMVITMKGLEKKEY